MNRKYYPAVDIMRLVCAILVIINHTNPLRPQFPLPNFILINVFGRISVPFFFISAGYLLAQSLKDRGNDYFKKYIFSLIRLYAIWFVIYLPFGLMRIHEIIPGTITPLLGVGIFIEAIFLHGSYFHLWYLAALIVGLVILYFFQKRFAIKYLLIIGVILFIFGLSETYIDLYQMIPVINKASEFYFKWFYTTRNGIFFALIFLALGFDLHQEQSRFHIKNPGIWSIVSFIALLIEALLLRYNSVPLNYNLLIMQIPFTICFFEFLKSDRFSHLKVSRKFREYNTWFYLTHAMFLELIPLGLSYINQELLWEEGWFRFISVMIFTFILSYIIINVKEKRRKPQVH